MFSKPITHGPAMLALCAIVAGPVFADLSGTPEGPVILTVTGAITETNSDDAATFDLEMLRELDAREVQTSTIWTDGVHSFRGISLDTLLELVGATGKVIEARAINDYAVKIPVEDATPKGPIVAYELNGKAMSRREKGPLWVIYPFDSSAEYRTEVIYSRSIWQLDRMDIIE